METKIEVQNKVNYLDDELNYIEFEDGSIVELIEECFLCKKRVNDKILCHSCEFKNKEISCNICREFYNLVDIIDFTRNKEMKKK
jgi:hypothetical protein